MKNTTFFYQSIQSKVSGKTSSQSHWAVDELLNIYKRNYSAEYFFYLDSYSMVFLA